MFDDIHTDAKHNIGRLPHADFTELLYADDTVLIKSSAQAMNKLLKDVQVHAAYLGLSFNQTKCVAMVFNSNQPVLFADGSQVPEADEVTYLGSVLSRKHAIRKEVATRTAAAMVVWRQLEKNRTVQPSSS